MNHSSFPLNAWYAAGWDHEVRRELLSRTICGKKVLLYRTTSGAAAALDDACWHRLVPLSLGRLEGDNVVCGYHGLTFEPGGRCVRMPSQETINPAACVRSYPLVERHRLVWIWPGDPALADPAKVPDMHWQDDSEWAGDGGTIPLACNYRLVLDNLMDLTHETFVHSSSIGNAALNEFPFTVTHEGDVVKLHRWMMGIDPPPFLKARMAEAGRHGDVDRWQLIRYECPSTITIDVGCASAGTGAPQGDRSQGVNFYVLNTITPETESTCQYFWSFSRNYRLREQGMTTILREGIRKVFLEDKAILEAQQQAAERYPDREFYNLNVDAGAMWARRLIERAIDRETLKPVGPKFSIRVEEQQ